MSTDQLLVIVNGGSTSAPATMAPVDAIHHIESNSAPDTSTVTNASSGAQGSMQVLPATAIDPGFGVKPSDGSATDTARAGRDYYAALQQKYGDPTTAAIAYNWGPGNTDKWLANGSPIKQVPTETLKYAVKFASLTGANQDQSAAPSAGGPVVRGVTDNPLPAVAPTDPSSPVKGFLGGIGEGFGDTALGAQALLGRGLQTVGATTPGDYLVNDAQQGKANLAAETKAYNSPIATTIGNVVGATAPMLAGGTGLLAQLGTGAVYGGSQAALDGQDIGKGTIMGAGLGAAGYGAGQLLGAAAQAASPTISKIANAFTGGEGAAAANIGTKLGGDIDPTIAALTQNSNEIIPGSLPTAAEAANNPVIVQAQRAAQNTAAGQAAFPARQAANNEARFAAGDQTVQPDIGPQLSDEVANFTQQQAARVKQGQAELPPISDAQAQVMQTPSYIQALNTAKGARAMAADQGSPVFSNQQATVQQGLAQGIQDIAGTPQTIAALKAARSAQAGDDFLSTHVGVPVRDLDSLRDSKLVQTAIQKVKDNVGNEQVSNPNYRVYASDRDEALASFGNKNAMYSGQFLAKVKQSLDGVASAANKGLATGVSTPDEARVANSIASHFVKTLDDAIPGYSKARANYAAASAPIDAQTTLQTRLNGAVDPLTGEVNPNRLAATINGVTSDQMKPGFRPADKVQPDQIQALQKLGQQAQAAPTNLVGLPGEGQEYIRQALAQRGGATEGAFNDYLAQNSPAYKEMLAAQTGRGADLESRQTLQDALSKLRLAANNASGTPAITYAAAKGTLNQPLTGGAEAYRQSLIGDLQRASTANAQLGAAGSSTAANAQLGGGLLGRLMSHRLTDTGIGAAAVTGHLPAAAIGYVVQRATAKAAAKTEAATIDLLLNPKKLAKALQEFKDAPQAKAQYIQTLKAKAIGAGAAGARAVQAFEATQEGK